MTVIGQIGTGEAAWGYGIDPPRVAAAARPDPKSQAAASSAAASGPAAANAASSGTTASSGTASTNAAPSGAASATDSSASPAQPSSGDEPVWTQPRRQAAFIAQVLGQGRAGIGDAALRRLAAVAYMYAAPPQRFADFTV